MTLHVQNVSSHDVDLDDGSVLPAGAVRDILDTTRHELLLAIHLLAVVSSSVSTPDGLTRITVRGKLQTDTGAAQRGAVTFRAVVFNAAADAQVTGSAVAAPLDSTGSFTIALPATDDPATTLPGFSWQVTEPSGNNYLIKVPIATAGGILDLGLAPHIGVTGPAGPAGAVLVPTSVKASAYTASPGDFVPVDTTAGNVAITLPTAPADRMQVGIGMVAQGGTNVVNVVLGGTDGINVAGGAQTSTIKTLNQGRIYQYKAAGAVWYETASTLSLSQLDLRFTTPAQATSTAVALSLVLGG